MSGKLVLKYINDTYDSDEEPPNTKEINNISSNSGITELHFDDENFNQEINGLDHIKTLFIKSTEFNSEIINCRCLVKLIINCTYFNNVIEFPETLEYFKINSDYYNKPLKLTKTQIKYLDICSNKFNHPLDNLPNTLETLILSNIYNYTCELNNLPPSLLYCTLYLPSNYSHDINYLPPKIKKLEIKFAHCINVYYKFALANLPNITELYLLNYFGDYNILPDSIELLDIKYSNDTNTDRNAEIKKTFNILNKLPQNLKILNYQSDIYPTRLLTFEAVPYLKQNFNILNLIISRVNLSGITVNGRTY